MTEDTSNTRDLEQYREIRSLIQSTALKENEEVLSFQNLRNLIFAFRKLHNLLKITCNPYEFKEISGTLIVCFKLIAGSYHLTQSSKEQLLLEDRMIVQDTSFVGTTIERQAMRKCWNTYEKDEIVSHFASTGTVHDHHVLTHTYPLLEEPWTPDSISTYAGIIPLGSEFRCSTKEKNSDMKINLTTMELAGGQYWSMAEAVQADPHVQTLSADVVLSSIYRDVPTVKQQPSKQRGSGRGLSRKGKDSNQIVRGSTMSLAANRLFCRMLTSFNVQSCSHAVLLVGPDGCGKSTLCQRIASLIGVKFLDLHKAIFTPEAGEDPTGSHLQDCIQREFQ